jgi:hypothetical protein
MDQCIPTGHHTRLHVYIPTSTDHFREHSIQASDSLPEANYAHLKPSPCLRARLSGPKGLDPYIAKYCIQSRNFCITLENSIYAQYAPPVARAVPGTDWAL